MDLDLEFVAALVTMSKFLTGFKHLWHYLLLRFGVGLLEGLLIVSAPPSAFDLFFVPLPLMGSVSRLLSFPQWKAAVSFIVGDRVGCFVVHIHLQSWAHPVFQDLRDGALSVILFLPQ